jgi:flavorubredoxin
MAITNAQSGTNVEETAENLYRISTPVADIAGGFSFDQFLILDEEPLVFHTGPRRLFPLTLEAVRHVLAPDRLRWIAFSHVEVQKLAATEPRLLACMHGSSFRGDGALLLRRLT